MNILNRKNDLNQIIKNQNLIKNDAVTKKGKKKIIGALLTVLLLLNLINSSYFFLRILKLNLYEWIAFNSCSLSIVLFLVFYATALIRKELSWLIVPLLPMYYYGTMGLYVMPWTEKNIFAHITHVSITVTVIWIIFVVVNMITKGKELRNLATLGLLSIIIEVPVFVLIQQFNEEHLHEFMKLLETIA